MTTHPATSKKAAAAKAAAAPKQSGKRAAHDEVAAKRAAKRSEAVEPAASKRESTVTAAQAAKLVEMRNAATQAQLELERYVRSLIAGGALVRHVSVASGIASSSIQNYVKREMRGQPT